MVAKIQASCMHSFTYLLQYFHMISLFRCLDLWNEFKVNSTLDIERK